jgi:hypothetical protein
MLAGIAFSKVPIKIQRNKILMVSGVAIAIAIVLIFSALLYQTNLSSIYTFDSFIAIIAQLPVANIVGDSIALTAAVILVGIFEAGLTIGFVAAVRLTNTKSTNNDPSQPIGKMSNQKIGSAKTNSPANSEVSKTASNTVTESLSTSIRAKDATGIAEEQGLKKDEQSIMELFIYGKISEITPVIDLTKPGGYYLKGLPKIGWDTKRARQILDSLVRKGFLKADLTDKMITCKSCGSANVRLKRACPDCRSLKLSKEGLIEHFSCGAVEKQDAFETKSGDLVCPKCKAKLQLIG